MAVQFPMMNPKTGEMKTALYGYSWTTLFFGGFPALFRKDFLTFLGFFLITAIFCLFLSFIFLIIIFVAWSFMYNKYYSINLLKQGFVFSGSDEENKAAAAKLGVVLNVHNTMPTTPDATNV